MGVLVPQVITEDRASGAQVIDGSLNINGESDLSYLTKTFSAGTPTTWTVSLWVKVNNPGNQNHLFFAGPNGSNRAQVTIEASGVLNAEFSTSGTTTGNKITTRVLRDPNSWYHIVIAVDTTIASPAGDRIKIYINGVRETSFTTSVDFAEDYQTQWMGAQTHTIAKRNYSADYFEGKMSQMYNIDGQALGPENFGFNDPLTNTWRPKKYEGTFGTNGFYLPFDGSALIHEDVSGRGNDFTPIKMWGHVPLDKATGGKPILRTVSGGNWGAAPLTERKTYVVTVASDGGNKYFLDGVNYTSTTIPLLRGGTYKFDQSDSTNSGHPLRFATAADAAGSTEYTSGVSQTGTPGNAGAYTVITVPHNAPDTLYYYCTNHNGMGGATSNSTDETKTDLYASSLVLAIPFNGDDNDYSGDINSGTTSRTTTVSGASEQPQRSNFYGNSYDFDGTNDFVKIDLTDNTDPLLFQSTTWTIEGWAFGGTGSNNNVFNVASGASANSDWVLQVRVVTNKWEGTLYTNGSTVTQIIYDQEWSPNRWTHFAFVREGNEQRLYIDGRLGATGNVSALPNNNNGSDLHIGGSFDGTSNPWNGSIQDIRVYDGVAKYTENFLVGSSNPNITPETPSGISYRSEFEKITDGAVSFDGNRGGDSGDYLALESGSDLQFGSGDFTIEAYVFPNSLSNFDPIIDNGSIAGNNQHDWRLYLGSVGEVWFDIEHSNGTYFNGSGASGGDLTYGVKARKWNHIAITRSGNTIYTFVDGVQKASTSFSGTIDSDYTTAYIGADNMVNGTMHYFDGFISNVRVLKGTALYTSDFTPPREPLTAVTNTKLLCCQSSSDANRPTVSPASTVNDGTDFSTNQVTGSAGLTGIPNLFNGQIGNYKNPDSGVQVTASADNHILWTPTTGIPYTSKVEVFCYAANGYNITNTYSVNGGAEVSFTGGGSNYNDNNWITVATGSGTINSIKIRLQRSGSVSNVQWNAVRIDGVVLVDNCTNTPIESYYDAVPTPFNANSTDVLGRISNYATLNPLDKSSQWTLSNGNLSATGGTQGGGDTFGQAASSKHLPTTGKYYIEMTKDGSGSDSNAFGVGVSRCNRGSTGSWPATRQGSGYVGFLSFEYGFTVTHDLSTGNIQYKNNDANATAHGVTYTGAYSGSAGNAKPYAIAIDCDNLKMRFYENGVQIGPVQTFVHPGPDAVVTFFKSDFQLTVNFGQKPFAFPPPEGFGPLCDANLPRPTSSAAVRPDKHFNTVLYPGTAVVGRSVTGVGFKPDLIWIKNRANGVANSWHSLTDSVRGERLFPNESIAEDPSKDVLSFLDDGMTLNYGTYVNFNGGTYAAWCWKAGDDDEIITYTTKVVSDSGNKYRFDDFGTSAVTLELAEGQTYIFDQSDSSNSGHPIRFSTTSDGTHGGGSEYTTGVVTEGTPGSAGAKTTITVASGAPTLHYYCSAHSGMGGQANTNTTKGYSNFYGTIQSRISANTDAGFSIVTYSGNNSVTASVGHGLNSEPKFIIVKSRNNSKFWTTYHASISKNTFKTLELNTAAVANDNPDNEFFGETQEINANVFTVGNPDSAASNSTNVTGNNYVAYCWAEIEGFSKFGTIKGNNSANGPYINCGFKPAWIMFKNTDAQAYWAIFDSARDTFNQCNKVIRADDDPDENTNLYFIDILSNGFKIRDSGGLNGTANTVYAAFAEKPTMNLYGAQANAR